MKVLWFGHRDIKHPRAGGAERTMYEVSRRLVKMGHEVTLATVNPGSLKSFEIIEGIKIIRVKGNIMAHLLAPLMIKKIDPDVIIDDLAHVVPWFSTFFTEKPVIAFFRHLHARSLRGQVHPIIAEVLKLMERQYSRIYSKGVFVTESDTSIRDLLSLGVPRRRIFKILPGVDHELFKPRKKFDEPTLVYFSGMRDYKRPWLSLYLLKELSNAKLIIVGDGPSFSRTIEKCKELNLCDRVSFTGRIDNERLAEIIARSWVNLHFSLAEGFGYTVLEAAACGTPTVALDAPGVSEVINEFGFGLVAKDLDDMKNKIIEIIKDYDTWSRRVYQNSLQFSWDKTAEEWDRLFKSLD